MECVVFVKLHDCAFSGGLAEAQKGTLSLQWEAGRKKAGGSTAARRCKQGTVTFEDSFDFADVLRRRADGFAPLPVRVSLRRRAGQGRQHTELCDFRFDAAKAVQLTDAGGIDPVPVRPDIAFRRSAGAVTAELSCTVLVADAADRSLQGLRRRVKRMTVSDSPSDPPPPSPPEPQPLALDGAAPFDLGERVECCLDIEDPAAVANTLLGIVRFVGRTHFADASNTPVWIGVELDCADGNCDGTAEGIVYFGCPPRHGVFLPPACVRSVAAAPSVRSPAEQLDAQLSRLRAETEEEVTSTPVVLLREHEGALSASPARSDASPQHSPPRRQPQPQHSPPRRRSQPQSPQRRSSQPSPRRRQSQPQSQQPQRQPNRSPQPRDSPPTSPRSPRSQRSTERQRTPPRRPRSPRSANRPPAAVPAADTATVLPPPRRPSPCKRPSPIRERRVVSTAAPGGNFGCAAVLQGYEPAGRGCTMTCQTRAAAPCEAGMSWFVDEAEGAWACVDLNETGRVDAVALLFDGEYCPSAICIEYCVQPPAADAQWQTAAKASHIDPAQSPFAGADPGAAWWHRVVFPSPLTARALRLTVAAVRHNASAGLNPKRRVQLYAFEVLRAAEPAVPPARAPAPAPAAAAAAPAAPTAPRAAAPQQLSGRAATAFAAATASGQATSAYGSPRRTAIQQAADTVVCTAAAVDTDATGPIEAALELDPALATLLAEERHIRLQRSSAPALAHRAGSPGLCLPPVESLIPLELRHQRAAGVYPPPPPPAPPAMGEDIRSLRRYRSLAQEMVQLTEGQRRDAGTVAFLVATSAQRQGAADTWSAPGSPPAGPASPPAGPASPPAGPAIPPSGPASGGPRRGVEWGAPWAEAPLQRRARGVARDQSVRSLDGDASELLSPLPAGSNRVGPPLPNSTGSSRGVVPKGSLPAKGSVRF